MLTHQTTTLTLRRQAKVYDELCWLADAPTKAVFEVRLTNLQAATWYTDNELLQKYLKDEWLSCEERWAEHARQDYHGAIDTNNHQESMNHVWKDKWLKDRIDTRMDSLLDIYRRIIVPHYWQEYVHDNVKSVRWACWDTVLCSCQCFAHASALLIPWDTEVHPMPHAVSSQVLTFAWRCCL